MPDYFIVYPTPYSTKCYNSSWTIYVVETQPASGTALSGKTDTLVKKRIDDCDKIIYPIKNPNNSGYPYFKIGETSALLTYLGSLGLTLDTDLTTLTRSQYRHAFVFHS